ncbi:hypothetical protein JRQ81_013830 [Phrynocephalus forsythii]|uniref:Uncharacterized protein n=1 Tax=Phrynocephalus forsythii TaxID=171643 RepID=A0A9Q0Y2K3_9SAUR|nr:hypothetical protein JRQ81_013830 [Phrynocephalus forsythii]
MEEQGVNSHPSEVFVTSSLHQPTGALADIPEEDEKPKPQPPEEEEEEEEEEDMVSLAAFLLSEANTICMSSLLTSEKENLDPQTPFVEAGLSAERLGSAFTDLSDIGKTTEEKMEAFTPSFEAEQFTSKPDTTLRCSVEDRVNSISDIPALPKFIQNELSSTITSEPIKNSHLHNLRSSVNSIASETMADKGIISAEDFAKTEEEKCFSHAEETLKEPETYFKKDEKRRDHEAVKESILAPELSRAKETVDTSESYEAASIDAPPFISSTGMEEDANGVESLEYLVTASSQKAKQVKDASVAIDNEPPVCKLRGDTSEGLKAKNREYKEKESKIYIGEKIVQESAGINLDVSVNLENQGDDILKPTSTDSVEKFILINDTSITQAGKEQSVEETQSSSEIKNEKLEEIPSSAARSENIMAFSLLERDLGDAFQGVVKGEM